jgi:hypothetical protein
MAISHLCLSCGHDLARIRVRRDPHYALPMVTCPDCGTAAVRRRHPSLQAWRTLLRVETSLFALAFQLAFLAAFATGVVSACVVASEQYLGGYAAVPEEFQGVAAILAFGVMPIALGAWLTAGLGHLRRLTAWLLFTVFAIALLSVDAFGAPLTQRVVEIGGFSPTLTEFRWDRLLARLIALVAIMTVATAGIPIGLVIRTAERDWRRTRWRARRRRLRARRTGR